MLRSKFTVSGGVGQKPQFRYHQSMQVEALQTPKPIPFQTYDARLEPIAARVLSGERLDFADGLALYGSPDVLAVGWLANHVRERMHGDTTYFNVNRHINPTNVCVAACKLCAFGRKKGDPAGYTMALEEAWETAASGYSEAVTEFHIVGGLHPDLPPRILPRSHPRPQAEISQGAH